MQHRLPRELRIIAGEWRGRKLRFPDRAGIRPTPDRVRETLFNWIGARVRESSGAFDTTIDGDEVLNVALG